MPQIIIKMNTQLISLPRNGRIVSNNQLFNVQNGVATPLTGTKTIEVVVVKIGNAEKLYPVWVPNQVFTDDAGHTYLLAQVKTEDDVAKKAEMIGAGYIIVREDNPEAWFAGKQVEFPTHLTNELGVRYMFVNFKDYGEVCKRVNGYCKAHKVEPILVDTNAKVGQRVESIVFGVREHDTVLEEGMVLVQNKFHGETYKMKVAKLEQNYELKSCDETGIEEWVPKNVFQEWTWTRENIVGVLWGSFEFLAGAMININDPEDVYGCNYVVFNGNDVARGSHYVDAVFEPANPLPKIWLEERELRGIASVLEVIPKTTYIQVARPFEVIAC